MRSQPRITRSRIALACAAAVWTAACASAHPQQAPVVAATPPPVAAAPERPHEPAGNGSLRAAVVTVRVTGQDWNWRAPWEKQAPWTRTVTGLVVPGRRILATS